MAAGPGKSSGTRGTWSMATYGLTEPVAVVGAKIRTSFPAFVPHGYGSHFRIDAY